MKEKLQLLMDHAGLKQGRFAELLETNPASISHILSGRNKPSFDLLQKILRRFPQISPDWLLLDSGPMLRAGGDAVQSTSDLFGDNVLSSGASTIRDGLFAEVAAPEQAASVSERPGDGVARGAESGAQADAAFGIARRSGAKVIRVVLFYDDRTFESFSLAE